MPDASRSLPVQPWGPRLAVMAGAVLLLLLTALTGIGGGLDNWAGSRPGLGDGVPAGTVQSERLPATALWGRLGSLAKPVRPQGAGLGGPRPDHLPPPLALPAPAFALVAPAASGPGHPGAVAPPPASGQLTARVPTGPPALPSPLA
ncbi:hypothetical protein [Phaeospirillum tilakii]|uniref:Uncharacterized protein n=1 Tax=Phaeospirillum tilakii TaxID=741673 RepID=A0ABW5CBE2_9PROT